MSVIDCVRAEEQNLRKYLSESIEELLVAANDVLNEESDCVFESGEEYKERVTGERVDRKWNKEMHVL